jgi:hypothetical protein
MGVSCDEGFNVTIALPGEDRMHLTARRVNADSHSAADPETGAPTGVDVHSLALDPDEAVQLARELSENLGIDAGPLRAWRREVTDNTSRGSVDSPFMRGRRGYYVHVILTWIRQSSRSTQALRREPPFQSASPR